MLKQHLQTKINEIKGGSKVNELISFMLDRGYTLDQFLNVENANEEIVTLLNQFFEGEVAVDNAMASGDDGFNMSDVSKIKKKSKSKKNADVSNTDTESQDEVENQEEINQENISDKVNKENVEVDKKESKQEALKTNATMPKKETNATIARKYKTIDNLIFLAETRHTVLEGVREVTDTGEDLIYSCELNGSELATMFLSGVLVYDPTMQRGLKENNKGEMRANFKDYHVREIYNSMLNNSFTPTQIHLGVISDDEELNYEYNTDAEELIVDGRIRLIDGQHRTRALAKILNELKVGRLDNVDIDKYVFNIQIHVTTAEYARIIYSNIDKNLKLDKSQVRQLSADHYARIVNALNQHSDSALKNKIATSKPVGNKLVLFNNIADALQSNIEINSGFQREEEIRYIKDFFDYLSFKLPKAFGNNEKDRVEFRKNNLLNENNAFQMWLKVAFLNKVEYQKNIDHIIDNVEFFNKDNVYWLERNTVKHKQKGEGFAMNNTNTGINAVTNKVLEMLGGDKNEGR